MRVRQKRGGKDRVEIKEIENGKQRESEMRECKNERGKREPERCREIIK